MLRFLKGFTAKFFQQRQQIVAPAAEDADRRESVRFHFGGRGVSARAGGAEGEMQIKNLSCGGAAAITELPVPLGGTVFLDLPGLGSRAAQVRWTRNTTMGLKFLRPLDMPVVLRLYSGPFERCRLLVTNSGIPVAVPVSSNENNPPDTAPPSADAAGVP